MYIGLDEINSKFLTKKVRIEYILLFLMISTFIISFPWISFFNYIRYFTLVVVYIYIILNISIILRDRKFVSINICVFILVVTSLVLSYVNIGTVERNSFLADIIDKGMLVSVLLSLEIFYHKGFINKAFVFTKRYIIFITLVTSVLILIFGDLVCIDKNYLIGNKFAVSFLTLFAFCLYVCDKNKDSIKKDIKKIVLFWLVLFFVSIRVSCATGVVASCLSIVLLLFFNNVKNKSVFTVIFIIISILSVWFAFEFESILSFPLIQTIIEDILHRDITLTTRTIIFSKVPAIIAQRFWTGYGFGSVYMLLSELIGAPNAQNGILNLILEEGFIVFVLYYLSMIYCIRKIDSRYNGIKIYIILLMFIASVEVSFDTSLLLYCIIGMVFSADKSNLIDLRKIKIESKLTLNNCS